LKSLDLVIWRNERPPKKPKGPGDPFAVDTKGSQ